MPSIRQPESIGAITRLSTTTASLAASRINIGGQQYVTTTALTLNTATVGAGGVDATLIASKVYYVYAVLSNGSAALIGSQASSLPSGFTQARVVGYFYSNATSQIQWANKTPEVIETVLISGSGTFVPQSTTVSMRVRLVGGGSGGVGSGTSAGSSPTVAGNTTFGTSLLTANGGSAGTWGSGGGAFGPPGGSSSISSPAFGIAIQGSQGSGSTGIANGGTSIWTIGGNGGSSPFGGCGTSVGSNVGTPAISNTGSGGGGGGGTTTGTISGAGGAAGGYIDAIITNPLSSYAYSVGAGGSAGGAGASGFAGGAGGSGIIIIDEYAQ